MNKYKVIETKKGRKLYYRNGTMISPNLVPISVLEQLEPGKVVTEAEATQVSQAEETPIKPTKSCLFCGQEAEYQRAAALQRVDLCEAHYYGMNVGKIVQQLRELENAQEAQETAEV